MEEVYKNYKKKYNEIKKTYCAKEEEKRKKEEKRKEEEKKSNEEKEKLAKRKKEREDLEKAKLKEKEAIEEIEQEKKQERERLLEKRKDDIETLDENIKEYLKSQIDKNVKKKKELEEKTEFENKMQQLQASIEKIEESLVLENLSEDQKNKKKQEIEQLVTQKKELTKTKETSTEKTKTKGAPLSMIDEMEKRQKKQPGQKKIQYKESTKATEIINLYDNYINFKNFDYNPVKIELDFIEQNVKQFAEDEKFYKTYTNSSDTIIYLNQPEILIFYNKNPKIEYRSIQYGLFETLDNMIKSYDVISKKKIIKMDDINDIFDNIEDADNHIKKLKAIQRDLLDRVNFEFTLKPKPLLDVQTFSFENPIELFCKKYQNTVNMLRKYKKKYQEYKDNVLNFNMHINKVNVEIKTKKPKIDELKKSINLPPFFKIQLDKLIETMTSKQGSFLYNSSEVLKNVEFLQNHILEQGINKLEIISKDFTTVQDIYDRYVNELEIFLTNDYEVFINKVFKDESKEQVKRIKEKYEKQLRIKEYQYVDEYLDFQDEFKVKLYGSDKMTSFNLQLQTELLDKYEYNKEITGKLNKDYKFASNKYIKTKILDVLDDSQKKQIEKLTKLFDKEYYFPYFFVNVAKFTEKYKTSTDTMKTIPEIKQSYKEGVLKNWEKYCDNLIQFFVYSFSFDNDTHKSTIYQYIKEVLYKNFTINYPQFFAQIQELYSKLKTFDEFSDFISKKYVQFIIDNIAERNELYEKYIKLFEKSNIKKFLKVYSTQFNIFQFYNMCGELEKIDFNKLLDLIDNADYNNKEETNAKFNAIFKKPPPPPRVTPPSLPRPTNP